MKASTEGLAPPLGDARFVLRGVPWEAYVALGDGLDAEDAVRVTYLDGALELVRPSAAREE